MRLCSRPYCEDDICGGNIDGWEIGGADGSRITVAEQLNWFPQLLT